MSSSATKKFMAKELSGIKSGNHITAFILFSDVVLDVKPALAALKASTYTHDD